MTYDKDIRVCRQTMIVLGGLMIAGIVVNLLVRNWIVSFTLWTWACWLTVAMRADG